MTMKRIWLLMLCCALLLPFLPRADAAEAEQDYRTIEYAGETYTYNESITTILYAGIDTDGDLTVQNRYTIAPRADALELVVMDHYHKRISILSISRDTIASVGRYTMGGTFRDYYETQIGYAYAYGDGGKVSCRNLTEAVSGLLGGVPIHEYVVTSAGSISEINDLAGGITVTVPNDDLTDRYPELSKGSTVKLDEHNVEAFLRWRDTEIPFSNNSRMERQMVFCTAFLKAFQTQAKTQPEDLWTKIGTLEGSLQTTITKAQYLKLAEHLTEETFSEVDVYTLAGADAAGRTHDELRLDEEKNLPTILKLFYLSDEDSIV